MTIKLGRSPPAPVLPIAMSGMLARPGGTERFGLVDRCRSVWTGDRQVAPAVDRLETNCPCADRRPAREEVNAAVISEPRVFMPRLLADTNVVFVSIQGEVALLAAVSSIEVLRLSAFQISSAPN